MELKNRGTSPKRGDVYWVRLDPPEGSGIRKTRPCLVISNSVLNEHRKTVVVVPFSSGPDESVLSPLVTCDGRDGVAVVDQIRAVAKSRLQGRIGAASDANVESVVNALRRALEL